MESLQVATQHAAITEDDVRRAVEEYFDCFNEQAFERVAALFGEIGQLKPPFDPVLVGSEAIADYLNRKAQNMTVFPNQWQILPPSEANESSESDGSCNRWRVEVKGQVQAAFTVNTYWQFVVSAPGEIHQARIRLLASPNELLNLRAFTS